MSASGLALPAAPALDLSAPRVMGVLNVTPDSFSDGGEYLTLQTALARGLTLFEQGAAIVDVGGESTRPGARSVTPSEERARVLPVIEALRSALACGPISIDTRRASVASAALAVGASLVNDVSGLQDPAMAAVCAEHGAPLVIGHIQGQPETMQRDPSYADVVAEVYEALAAACERAVAAGVDPSALLVDPGIGFGKTQAHNLSLLANLDRFASLGPVVIGVSRKSLLGSLTGRGVAERLAAGLGAAVSAALHGARLIRTHDVQQTHDALQVAWAIQTAGASDPRPPGGPRAG